MSKVEKQKKASHNCPDMIECDKTSTLKSGC